MQVRPPSPIRRTNEKNQGHYKLSSLATKCKYLRPYTAPYIVPSTPSSAHCSAAIQDRRTLPSAFKCAFPAGILPSSSDLHVPNCAAKVSLLDLGPLEEPYLTVDNTDLLRDSRISTYSGIYFILTTHCCRYSLLFIFTYFSLMLSVLLPVS